MTKKQRTEIIQWHIDRIVRATDDIDMMMKVGQATGYIGALYDEEKITFDERANLNKAIDEMMENYWTIKN